MGLYVSPWVQGSRAVAYYGPVSTSMFIGDEINADRSKIWERSVNELLDGLREIAFGLGANAVVGVEMSTNPFAVSGKDEESGLSLHVIGTAARLEDLW